MKYPVRVIHFAINYKLARDCLSSHNNAGLISKDSEKVENKIAKNYRRQQPQSFDACFPRNHQEYPHIPYISRN